MDYKSLEFPKEFWWGSATSGPQSEGSKDKRHQSIWEYWYDKEPEKFHNKIGPGETSTMYENYKSDIKLMKKIGHNSFRTSIQWSRLVKDFKTGEVDKKALDFYNSYINELIKNNIEPFINLFHFDMPMELQEIGGWENKDVVDMYVLFAKTCFINFGDRVKKWFTFNEPIVHTECGYLYQYHYPCLVNLKRAVQVGYNTQLASSLAIREYKKLDLNGEIGIILSLTPSYPRSQNEKDINAAQFVDNLFNKSFLDPSAKGGFNKALVSFLRKQNLMPEYTKSELEVIRNNTIDILGVNYYQPKRIKTKESPISNKEVMPEDFFDYYDYPDKILNIHRGWEIYYKGIYDIAKNIQNNYGNIQWYIAENGMGVENEEKNLKEGQIQDDYRVDFIKNHLKWLHKAIVEGANCKGYHLWTFIDCWSWLNSYKNRYGYVNLDLNTQVRTVKKSGEWIKEVSKTNKVIFKTKGD